MKSIDAIKNSVLEGFASNIAPTDILAALAVALAAGVFILLVYRFAMCQVSFNRSYCMTLLLVSAISAMMVLTITSNLALSLGMVGALSIVRFRTAIKDTSDTAFLFWAVAAGITAGAGYYLLTLIGCIVIGVTCLVAMALFATMSKAYLLVIRTEDPQAAVQVEQLLKAHHLRSNLTAMTENKDYTELIYELAFTQRHKDVLVEMKAVPGVRYLSLVDCRKS